MGLEVAIYLLMSFFGFTLLTFIILPIIRKLSLKFTSPESLNHKSSNSELVLSFGGVAFFISLLFTIIPGIYFNAVCVFTFIIFSSMTSIFLIGFKDDLKVFSAKSKLLGQLSAL